MELRLAWRRLRRRPAASLSIVIAVALAMAVVCALFAVLDGLLFRPLPFLEAERLVTVDYRPVNGHPAELAYAPEFGDQRAALRDRLAGSPLVAGTSHAGFATFFDPDLARDIGLDVQGVDAQFFPLLGLEPVLGSIFTSDDERAPATLSRASREPLPIVIGHALRERLYAGDPAVLGIHDLAGRAVRIVGVMGPGVKFPGETNVWAPVPSTRPRPASFARLAPAATIEQLAGAFPELQFTPLGESVHPGKTRALPLLFGAAVVLLVITWVQVAALTVSGSLGQLQEIGVRLALGAGRAQLIRPFAVESAVIASASLGAAWLIVRPITAFMVRMLPADLSRGQYLDPDFRTFVFGCAASFVGFGLLTVAPIGLARRAGPLGLVHGRLAHAPVSIQRWRSILLVGQMTLTAVLLYLFGLAAHSFEQATTFDYGFDAEHVLVFTPPPWARLNATTAQMFAAYDEHKRAVQKSVDLLRGVPGVVGAATFFRGPLGTGLQAIPTQREELIPITRFDGQTRTDVRAQSNTVGPDFVRAIGATLVAGSSGSSPEYASRDNVVIINEALAQELSPSIHVAGGRLAPSVVGRTLEAPDVQGSREIIGVIKNLVSSTPDAPPQPQLFGIDRRSSAAAGVAIRVSSPVEVAVPAIRAALERVWGPLRTRQFSLMRDELDVVLLPYRGQSLLLGLIAACCLPIAGIGLMGALMVSVQSRTREIAIRLAIGADPVSIRRAVIRRALMTMTMGIVAGTAIGATAGRVIAHDLFQVHPADVSTMIGVAAGLLCLGWAAAIVPARRASRVDPADALRQG